MRWLLRWEGFGPGWSSRIKPSTQERSSLPGITPHPYSPLSPLWFSQLHPIAYLCKKPYVTVKVITVLRDQELAKCLQNPEGALIGCALHPKMLATQVQGVVLMTVAICFDLCPWSAPANSLHSVCTMSGWYYAARCYQKHKVCL